MFSQTIAIATLAGIDSPLSQTTVVLPHRAQPKATTANASSVTIAGVPAETCIAPISQARASATPGIARDRPTATASPTTMLIGAGSSPKKMLPSISTSPMTSTTKPRTASGIQCRQVVDAVMDARESQGATDQLVEEVGVGHPCSGEHPRDLGMLGHPRHGVDLVEHRAVLGEEEVDPGDA